MSTVFIAFQANEETRPIVEAILADNPEAVAEDQPAMVKVSAPDRLTINRATVEELIGRSYDLQEMQINLITLSGHVDEDDEFFTLSWNS
jgi:phenol/toluene 2-monooxygenase (NADH) P2/A2